MAAPNTLIAHNDGSPVLHREAYDVASASGAIAIPSGDTTIFITKTGSLAALTLADPTAGVHDGVRLTVIATTAYAHTLTNTTGFNAAGTSGDVGTFGGARGDGIRLVAYGGVWYVLDVTNVTIA